MDSTPEPSPARRRVGVFGGTFDPPHLGHLSAARDVADHLGLDELVWVPAHRSPLKFEGPFAPDPIRLEMVRTTAAEDSRFRVSTVELDRAGPSYAVDTLRELGQGGGANTTDFFLIVGMDQYRAFDDWKSPEEIHELAVVAVMDRAGEGLPDGGAEAANGRFVRVPVSRVEISSTGVRAAVREGRAWAAMVAAPVADVIRREGLYRAPVHEVRLDQRSLELWGERVGAAIVAPAVVVLAGPLGAGKSVLARAIGRGAGVEEPMPSPTYNLLLRYETPSGASIVHIDLYRVESTDELWELGWAQLVHADEIALIEWPQRAVGFLPRDHWRIELAIPEGEPLFRDVAVRRVGAPPDVAVFPLSAPAL